MLYPKEKQKHVSQLSLANGSAPKLPLQNTRSTPSNTKCKIVFVSVLWKMYILKLYLLSVFVAFHSGDTVKNAAHYTKRVA